MATLIFSLSRYFTFFLLFVLSLKSNIYLTFIAHLKSDQPHFKCSIVTAATKLDSATVDSKISNALRTLSDSIFLSSPFGVYCYHFLTNYICFKTLHVLWVLSKPRSYHITTDPCSFQGGELDTSRCLFWEHKSSSFKLPVSFMCVHRSTSPYTSITTEKRDSSLESKESIHILQLGFH